MRKPLDINIILISSHSAYPDFNCRRYIGKGDFPEINLKGQGSGLFDFDQSDIKVKLTLWDHQELHREVYQKAEVQYYPSGERYFKGKVEDWDVDDTGNCPIITFTITSYTTMLNEVKMGYRVQSDGGETEYRWGYGYMMPISGLFVGIRASSMWDGRLDGYGIEKIEVDFELPEETPPIFHMPSIQKSADTYDWSVLYYQYHIFKATDSDTFYFVRSRYYRGTTASFDLFVRVKELDITMQNILEKSVVGDEVFYNSYEDNQDSPTEKWAKAVDDISEELNAVEITEFGDPYLDQDWVPILQAQDNIVDYVDARIMLTIDEGDVMLYTTRGFDGLKGYYFFGVVYRTLNYSFPMDYVNASFADVIRDIAIVTNTAPYITAEGNDVKVWLRGRNFFQTNPFILSRRYIHDVVEEYIDRRQDEIPELVGFDPDGELSEKLNTFYRDLIQGDFVETQFEILNNDVSEYLRPWNWVQDDRTDYGYVKSMEVNRNKTKLAMERRV